MANVVKTSQKIMFSARLRRIIRAYPSLNLIIKVDQSRRNVDLVLPGLRFEDIDYSGKPDVRRVYDMMGRVEFAAFNHDNSFLDYTSLFRQNITTLVKACRFELKRDFYETTVAKAPLAMSLKLVHVADDSFTTLGEFSCGGKMRASVKMLSTHMFINFETYKPTPTPDWWRQKFTPNASLDPEPKVPIAIDPMTSPDLTFSHFFYVPHSDVDTYGRTRCSSYMRYFIDTASIASSRNFYKNMDDDIHEFPVRRMNMLYTAPSCWGDKILAETWEDPSHDNKLHCLVSKGCNPCWYGTLELHSLDE